MYYQMTGLSQYMTCHDWRSLAYVASDELGISGLSVRRLRLPVGGSLFKLGCPATLTQYSKSTATNADFDTAYTDSSAH